jgi:hypothetical protein
MFTTLSVQLEVEALVTEAAMLRRIFELGYDVSATGTRSQDGHLRPSLSLASDTEHAFADTVGRRAFNEGSPNPV